ncbi:hypothetical protein AB0C07_09215 [Actinoplanes missouriensis]|uniref:hypothetical protein n=1 Tax=Actinoplanes missouriensis TaxID=1866 RepID=UPI0033D13F06
MSERLRRSSAYLSSSTGGPRRELFRSAELNPAGWAAVAGICLCGAATGWAVTRVTGVPPWITTTVGAAAAFAAVVAADRRKWAGMSTTYSWTDDLAEVERVAMLLRRAGIDASAVTDGRRPALRYRNGDLRHVNRAFRDAGLPPPWAPA